MRHDEAERLIASLALGELEAEERRAVEAHVAECEVCRQALAETRATVSLLQEAMAALPREALDAGRVAAVLAVAQVARAPEPPAAEVMLPGFGVVPPTREGPAGARRLRRRVWALVGVAAALVVCFFGLVAPALYSVQRESLQAMPTASWAKPTAPAILSLRPPSTAATAGAPASAGTGAPESRSRQPAGETGQPAGTVDPRAVHAQNRLAEDDAKSDGREQGDAFFFRQGPAAVPRRAAGSQDEAGGTGTVRYRFKALAEGAMAGVGLGPAGSGSSGVMGPASGGGPGMTGMPGAGMGGGMMMPGGASSAPGAGAGMAASGMPGGGPGAGPGGMVPGPGGMPGAGMGNGGGPGAGVGGMMPGMGPTPGVDRGVIAPDVAFGSFSGGKAETAETHDGERRLAERTEAWFDSAEAPSTPAAAPDRKAPEPATEHYGVVARRDKRQAGAAAEHRSDAGDVVAALTGSPSVETAPALTPAAKPPPTPVPGNAEPSPPAVAVVDTGVDDRAAQVLRRAREDTHAGAIGTSVASESLDANGVATAIGFSSLADLVPAATTTAAPEPAAGAKALLALAPTADPATADYDSVGLASDDKAVEDVDRARTGSRLGDRSAIGQSLGERLKQSVPALGDVPVVGRLLRKAGAARRDADAIPAMPGEHQGEDLYSNKALSKEADQTPLSLGASFRFSSSAEGTEQKDRQAAGLTPESTVRLLVENVADLAPADRERLSESLRETQAGDLEQERPLSDEELAGPPPAPPSPVNPFVMTGKDRFSTFALEADTASYALARRYLAGGRRPPPGLIRMEEFINAFDYSYPAQSTRTFAIHAEAGPAPFGRDLTLLKVGVKARVLGRDGRKPAHLVFVIDTSGSMGREDRLPLVRSALGLMATQLDARDRLSLVTYDSQARLLLEAISAARVAEIQAAAAALTTEATTNLLAGVELGYQIAARHFRSGETNRVILCTDGVANVGPADAEAVLAKVAQYRRQGITLTSVGVGSGSYDDRMLEQLANKGDGNYVFVDSPEQARRVFVDDFAGTLQMVARNAKIQVEFNPTRVRRYRLIGYENRDVADKDFRNDAVDAGEIGSGQAATALYEIELLPAAEDTALLPDMGSVYVRYENVDTGRVEEISARLSEALRQERVPERAPRFFLAACSAEFAEILRESEHARDGSLEALEGVATRVANALPLDQRAQELLTLVRKADGLPR